ncbi:MAG: hypothetical protein ACLUNQ_08790 [Oscillospiraceae bacterium]
MDSVGISTAGVVIDGEIRRSSLFMGVEQATYDRLGRDLLARAVRETCGNVPWAASNDGDVAALAGAVSLGRRKLLGIALGTSEAGGYVDGSGRITGRLHELRIFAGGCEPRWPQWTPGPETGAWGNGTFPRRVCCAWPGRTDLPRRGRPRRKSSAGSGPGPVRREPGNSGFFGVGTAFGADPTLVSAAHRPRKLLLLLGRVVDGRRRRVPGGFVPGCTGEHRSGTGDPAAGGFAAPGGSGCSSGILE